MAKQVFVLKKFMNGITQGYLAPRNYFFSDKSRKETEEIEDMKLDWVSLCVNQFQETFSSTRIFQDNVRTISDEELELQIERLHQSGINIMLKPMIDPLDSIWRGAIAQCEGNIIAEVKTNTIAPWFESYTQMILRYAYVAEKTNCEMFCIGCELNGMERHCEEWKKIIRKVRKVYTGLITYNMTMDIANFDSSRDWFSELDLIGVSGYFRVGPKERSSSLKEMLEGWKPWVDQLEKFHEHFKTPVFFAECGVRPIVGAAGITGDFRAKNVAYCAEDQVNYYLAIQESFCDKDWFYGSMWWKLDEHQYRKHFYLKDGHYVGCEPTPLLQREMEKWCGQNSIARKTIEPAKI
ncbi:MAG: hypothetical protein WCS73_03595 [Lentisphaeria bacterium]